MEINLVIEALKFMLLGMGVVFTFLIILIFILKIQAALISKFFPTKDKNLSNKQQSTSVQSTKIAAIIAAVQHHKNLEG